MTTPITHCNKQIRPNLLIGLNFVTFIQTGDESGIQRSDVNTKKLLHIHLKAHIRLNCDHHCSKRALQSAAAMNGEDTR
jgi:hypothetical protein